MPDNTELTLAHKVDILFAFGQMWGIDTDYEAMAKATGASSHNIKKLRSGDNDNPGLKTLKALADYFGVRLGYFDNKTREECWEYLNRHKHGTDLERLEAAPALLRSDVGDVERNEIEEALHKILRFVRRSEGLSDDESSR